MRSVQNVLLMKDVTSYTHGPTADVLTAGNLSDLYDVAIDMARFVGSDRFTFAPRFAVERPAPPLSAVAHMRQRTIR